MKNAAFDRVTGEQTLADSEREDAVRASSAWPFVYLEAWGKRYRVLGAELWDAKPRVYRLDLEGGEHGVPEVRRALVVETLRARELDARRALENEQTDSRAIAWLRERGKLVEREGVWCLKE